MKFIAINPQNSTLYKKGLPMKPISTKAIEELRRAMDKLNRGPRDIQWEILDGYPGNTAKIPEESK